MSIKQSLTSLAKKGMEKAVKDSPKIAIGVSAVASMAAIVFAIRNTPAAHDILADHEREKECIENDLKEGTIDEKEAKKLKAKGALATGGKLAWNYAPTIILEAVSISGAVMSHKINVRRQMALEALYKSTSAALSTQTKKLEELLPKKRQEEVKQAVAEEQTKRVPPPPGNNVYNVGGKGTHLFLEPVTGHYFWARPETVEHAINATSQEALEEGHVSLRTFLDHVGVPVHYVSGEDYIGDYLGFQKESMNDGSVDISVQWVNLENIDGDVYDAMTDGMSPATPIGVISYGDLKPKYNYYGDF